jgi:hypothetical protein
MPMRTAGVCARLVACLPACREGALSAPPCHATQGLFTLMPLRCAFAVLQLLVGAARAAALLLRRARPAPHSTAPSPSLPEDAFATFAAVAAAAAASAAVASAGPATPRPSSSELGAALGSSAAAEPPSDAAAAPPATPPGTFLAPSSTSATASPGPGLTSAAAGASWRDGPGASLGAARQARATRGAAAAAAAAGGGGWASLLTAAYGGGRLSGSQLYDLMTLAILVTATAVLRAVRPGSIYYWLKDITSEFLKMSVLSTAFDISDRVSLRPDFN